MIAWYGGGVARQEQDRPHSFSSPYAAVDVALSTIQSGAVESITSLGCKGV